MCPNTTKYVQICPSVFKNIQKRPKASGNIYRVQKYPNVPKSDQLRPNPSECCQNLPKSIQMRPKNIQTVQIPGNPSESIQTRKEQPKFDKPSPNLFESVQIHSN